MNEVHQALACIVGALSLAIVRKEPPRALLPEWIRTLRRVADALETISRGAPA